MPLEADIGVEAGGDGEAGREGGWWRGHGLPVSRMQAGSVNSPGHRKDKSENSFEEMGGGENSRTFCKVKKGTSK